MYDMYEWKYYADGAATFHTVDGGHFFITENCGPVEYYQANIDNIGLNSRKAMIVVLFWTDFHLS